MQQQLQSASSASSGPSTQASPSRSASQQVSSAVGNATSSTLSTLGDVASAGVSAVGDAASALVVNPLKRMGSFIKSSFTLSLKPSEVFPQSRQVTSVDVFPPPSRLSSSLSTTGVLRPSQTNEEAIRNALLAQHNFLSTSSYNPQDIRSVPLNPSNNPLAQGTPITFSYSVTSQFPSSIAAASAYPSESASAYPSAFASSSVYESDSGYVTAPESSQSSSSLYPLKVNLPSKSSSSRLPSSRLPSAALPPAIPEYDVIPPEDKPQYRAQPPVPVEYNDPLAASYYIKPREFVDDPFPEINELGNYDIAYLKGVREKLPKSIKSVTG